MHDDNGVIKRKIRKLHTWVHLSGTAEVVMMCVVTGATKVDPGVVTTRGASSRP
jgi:hypothetical protein